MSSKSNATGAKEKSKSALVPKLRFPEFKSAGDWTTVKLGAVATIRTEKVGNNICVPMSITSGVGLLSQEDKFGRVIAGDSYKNYLLLKPYDFAYNKSATKEYPEGFLTLYVGTALAAVPNSIFTCFRINGVSPDVGFLNYQFSDNLHGRWLRKFIQVGARAHGSLSIDDNDLMALPVPLPAGSKSTAEQKKIAECLTSVDKLLDAQARKVDALKVHKKALMQQLFPRKGETKPRLRFPEFQDAREWESDSLGNIFETSSGGTPSRTVKAYWNGDIPWVTTSLVDFGVITSAEEFLTSEGLKNSSAKLFPKGTVLMAMYGQGKTRGQVALLGIKAATNQACAAILPRKDIDPYFVFLNLAGRYEEIREMSNSGGQDNLSQGLVREIRFAFPPDAAEQRKVTVFLSSLDSMVNAESQKLEALKTHKRGLMQKLIPSAEEER
jgi:type I restriction enzyme S subunit